MRTCYSRRHASIANGNANQSNPSLGLSWISAHCTLSTLHTCCTLHTLQPEHSTCSMLRTLYTHFWGVRGGVGLQWGLHIDVNLAGILPASAHQKDRLHSVLLPDLWYKWPRFEISFPP